MKKKAWPQRDPEPPFESSRHSKPVFWLSVSVLNVIYVFCIVYVVLLLCVSELYSPSAGFECAENGQWLCIIINILVVHSYSQLSSLLRYINWQVPSHTHTIHTYIKFIRIGWPQRNGLYKKHYITTWSFRFVAHINLSGCEEHIWPNNKHFSILFCVCVQCV